MHLAPVVAAVVIDVESLLKGLSPYPLSFFSSSETDKNLYEIICQQQSLLEESGNLPQHSSTMREDSIGGGLVSKPDSRLSNVNVTAPYPPSSATDTNFASMQYYQNDFGTLTHPGTPVAPAGGIASQHQMHSAAPRDFMSMQNQPQQQPRQAQQPIFEHPQTLPTALDTFMVDQTLRRPSLPGVQQMFSEATPTVNTRASLQSSWSQLQPPPQQAQPNFAMAMPFSGTNQVAPLAPVQLSELAQSLAATIRQPNQEGPVDNPFEPVPLPEGNQAGINVNGAELQSLPDDIDNIFDDT